VCIPSRAMVNSGQAYFRIPNDLEGVKLLPELLGENGYTTFATGKWHNQEPSFLRGFARGKAVFFGGMSDHTKVPVQDVSADGQLINKRIGEKFSSELFADAAIDFLENYREEKPFYAYIAFTAPHDPRQPPEDFRQMYYDARPPLPNNFMPQHPFNNGHMTGRDESLAAWPRTKEVVGDQLAEYYGMIAHLDGQIGRILEALEKSGHADNTIIIYAADHGLAVGSHGLLGKQSLYEHSMSCPLIITGAGIPKGQATNALTYLLDIFPTVCELAGIASPSNLDGQNLQPIWRGEKQAVRNSTFLAFTNLMRSARDDRWKLIRYPQINHMQLFDLQNDPDELRNLADDPGQAGRIEQLTSLMREWQQKVGDADPLTVDNPQPKEIDLTGHERTPDNWQPEWIRQKYFGTE
jgi:arylsulfatase A-like enzyme